MPQRILDTKSSPATMRLQSLLLLAGAAEVALAVPNTLEASISKRTDIGVPTKGINAAWFHRTLTTACGLQSCDQASCHIGWTDETGCRGEIEVGGVCQFSVGYDINETHKKVCGNAWAKECSYSPDYYSAYVWNGGYQLSVVTVKKKGMPVGKSEVHRSCSYGMRLDENYRGDFSCNDLNERYRHMIDRIPYDGC